MPSIETFIEHWPDALVGFGWDHAAAVCENRPGFGLTTPRYPSWDRTPADVQADCRRTFGTLVPLPEWLALPYVVRYVDA